MQTFQLARQPIVAHLLKAPAAIISGVWALISTLVYAPLYIYHYTFDRLLFAQIFEENNLAYVALWPLRQLGAAVGLALPLLEIVGVLKLLFVLMPFNSVIIAFITILSVGLLLMASVQKGCSLVGEKLGLPRELKLNAYAILLLQGAQDIMSLILTLFILVTVFQVQKLMDFQPLSYSRRYFGFVCNLAKPVFVGILLAFSACLLTDFLITFTTFTGFTFMSQAKVQAIKAKQAESVDPKINEPRKLASAEIAESHTTEYLVTLVKVFVFAAVFYVMMQLASRFQDMMKNVRRVQSTKQESDQRKVILHNLESSFDRPQLSIEKMPPNVLGEIFSYMHPVEQVRMTQVSHTFRTAVLRKGYFTDLESNNERTKNSLNTGFKHYTNWSSFYEKRTVLLSVLTEVCRAIGNLPYIFLGVLYIPAQILNMSVDPQANLHRMRDAAASLTDDKVYIFEACKFNPANRLFVTPHQRKMLTLFEYKPEYTDKLVANKFLYLGALITYIIQAIFFETAYLFNLPVYILLKASSYGSMNGIFINPSCEETVIIPAYEMEPCIKKILLFVCQPFVMLITMIWTALLNGLVLRLTWMILSALGVLPQTFNFALAFAVGVSALIWFEYYHLMKAFLVQYFPFFQPARAILCCLPVFKMGFVCVTKAILAMLHSLANKCIASYNKVLTLCLLWSSRKGCLGDVALAAFTSAWMFWPLMLALISMEPIMFIPCGIASSFLVMKGYETTKSIADPTSPREHSSYMNFTQSPV